MHSALLGTDAKAAQRWLSNAIRGSDPILRKRVFSLLPELVLEDAQPIIPLLLSLFKNEAVALKTRIQAVYVLV